MSTNGTKGVDCMKIFLVDTALDYLTRKWFRIWLEGLGKYMVGWR